MLLFSASRAGNLALICRSFISAQRNYLVSRRFVNSWIANYLTEIVEYRKFAVVWAFS
jgi:hypothetical protein